MFMNRREFLKLSAAAPLISAVSAISPDAAFAIDKRALEIVPVSLRLGASRPFKALHISDTHLTFADDRENERKRTLAKNRSRHFGPAERWLDASLEYAKSRNEILLHTGDLIDFVSEKNLDFVQEKLQNADCFVSSGNHEFSQYVGEAKEDAAYKAQSYDRVQKAFPNDLTFCSREINRINFVALDDVYYNVTEDQFRRFQAEIDKGLPIVALCHCPFYTPELFETAMRQPNAKCAYLTGVPKDRTADYEAGRREQQNPDGATLEFLDWLRAQPLLKAVFCGHLHYFWSGPFSPTATQYVVGGHFKGCAYEIAFD